MKKSSGALSLPVKPGEQRVQGRVCRLQPFFRLRLQVYLARSGCASRRACEALIASGRVTVDGQTVTTQGRTVCAQNVVCVDGTVVQLERVQRYVLLYKPVGYICSLAPQFPAGYAHTQVRAGPSKQEYARAIDLVQPAYQERLYHIGRLDVRSEGALLFTNDGSFAQALGHPRSGIEKEYIVETREPVPAALLSSFVRGVWVEGCRYRCVRARHLAAQCVQLVLVEGKKREIRVVFEAWGQDVVRLVRVRIGRVRLGPLRPGAFRTMRLKEVAQLLQIGRAHV